MSDFWDAEKSKEDIGNPKSDFWDHAGVETTDADPLAQPKGFVGNALDTLGYLGRVSRTAVAAPFSEKYSAGDVVDQALHLHPENAVRAAPSGRDLIDMAGLTEPEMADIQVPKTADEAKKLNPKDVESKYMWDGIKQGLYDAAGMGAEVATDPLTYAAGFAKGISGAAEEAAPLLKKTADSLYLKSTGATPGQIEKFGVGAADELRKHVRFGDSAANVAERVAGAHDQAGKVIGDTVRELDAMGVKANLSNVVNSLESKAQMLSKNSSKADVVRKLRGIIDDIKETGNFEAVGPHEINQVPVGSVEEAKRGFGEQVKNWADPNMGRANKEAYLSHMDEVERAATEANPELADKFINAKKTYSLLAPIEEASAKAANRAASAAPVGAKDLLAGAAGGWKLAAANKLISPRLASSGAVTADMLSKMATATPKLLGKFAPLIDAASKRGGQAVAATHFILQQSNPEYRELLKKIQEPDGDEQEPWKSQKSSP